MTRAEIFTPSVQPDPDDADFVKTEGISSIKKETRTLRKRMQRFGGHDDADGRGRRTADLGGGRSDCSRGCVRWQPACRRRAAVHLRFLRLRPPSRRPPPPPLTPRPNSRPPRCRHALAQDGREARAEIFRLWITFVQVGQEQKFYRF